MKKQTLFLGCLLALFLALGALATRSAEAQSPHISWQAEYYPNIWFGGDPIRYDSIDLNRNWGLGSPGPGIPIDYFSARFRGTVNLNQPQTMRITVSADDTARILVNGKQVINLTAVGTQSADVPFNEGTNDIYVEYKEYVGNANLNVNIAPVEPIEPRGNVKVEYFNNTWLGGEPVHVEYHFFNADRRLLLDWGSGAPAPSVNTDYFSARISYGFILNGPGPYRFNVVADDKMRVLVNGNEVVKTNGAFQRGSGVADLTGYEATVTIEYVEYVGTAFVDISYDKTRYVHESRLVQQQFENGWMIWLEDTDKIYVLYDDASPIYYYHYWDDFEDTFEEDQPHDDPTIQAPAGKQQPRRGFGKVWREQPHVRDLLGWATSSEQICDSLYSTSVGFSGRGGGTSMRLCDWRIASLGWSTGRGWSISPYNPSVFEDGVVVD